MTQSYNIDNAESAAVQTSGGATDAHDVSPAPPVWGRLIGVALPALLFVNVCVGLWIAAVTNTRPEAPTGGAAAAREFTGIAYATPYPMMRIRGLTQRDTARTVYLLEQGLTSAAERTAAFHGRQVRVRGRFAVRGGQRVLELEPGAAAIRASDAMSDAQLVPLRPPMPRQLGAVTLPGTIVDAVSLVRGDGEPDPDAVTSGRPEQVAPDIVRRNIARGAPPLLEVRDRLSKIKYYLLTDLDRRPLGDALAPFAGRRVKVSGQLELHGDVRMLKVNIDDIQRQ